MVIDVTQVSISIYRHVDNSYMCSALLQQVKLRLVQMKKTGDPLYQMAAKSCFSSLML